MFKHIFETIAGIEIFPIVALLIFIMFFAGVVIWVLRMDRDTVKRLKKMPLDSSD